MDVFGTVINAGNLILKFLGACAAYSDDAKSLQTRFDWDLRVLKAISAHFDHRRSQGANQQLSPDDAALLERTALYFDGLFSKMQRKLGWIERNGLLHSVINRGMWIARQAELQALAREVNDWTRRFDVRLLGVPQDIRTIIPASGELELSAVIRSNDRLHAFLGLSWAKKIEEARKMRLKNSERLMAEIISSGDASILPPECDGEQLILASRSVSQAAIRDPRLFGDLDTEMGILAAALNLLEPTADVRLLKVESYFYHAESHQFLFSHIAPDGTQSMMTLESAIDGDHFPEVEAALNHRLKLAHKLAEVVLFIHSAGFVHKNISSSSVVVLDRANTPSNRSSTYSSVDDAYLMGFDLIRGIEARTYKEGAVREAEEEEEEEGEEEERSIWDYDIFQHPDRLQGENAPRYTKSYDVYSLGVLLLEIGLWVPLKAAMRNLNEGDTSNWARELNAVVSKLGARTGEKYQRLVAWCLAIDGSSVVKETEFVEQVLDPLEEITNALS